MSKRDPVQLGEAMEEGRAMMGAFYVAAVQKVLITKGHAYVTKRELDTWQSWRLRHGFSIDVATILKSRP